MTSTPVRQTPAEETLAEALGAFDFGASEPLVERCGQGHINDTFLVTASATGRPLRHILQRISTQAFASPAILMKNIIGITEFCRNEIEKAGGDSERGTLRVIRPTVGGDFFTDSKGGAWRVYPFIEGTRCYQTVSTPGVFAAAGRAFGGFQKMLEGYPMDTLQETIPRFHDTPNRLAQFRMTLKEDKLGRSADCQPEIAFIEAREQDCAVCMDALERGELRLRATHNDAKLNNVLFDEKTGEGVCVVDLDTVMPGLLVNDFGDSIRSGANHAAEDERDLGKVNLDLHLVRVYAEAFKEGCAEAITPEETRYLMWGAKLMTLECGIRFLSDYLQGDIYYHIQRPGQNLDRCRTQIKLVSDMEAHWDELEAIASSLLP